MEGNVAIVQMWARYSEQLLSDTTGGPGLFDPYSNLRGILWKGIVPVFFNPHPRPNSLILEGKEREGGRETSIGYLSHPPTGDRTHNPGMCPDWASRPVGLQMILQAAEPHRPVGKHCHFTDADLEIQNRHPVMPQEAPGLLTSLLLCPPASGTLLDVVAPPLLVGRTCSERVWN